MGVVRGGGGPATPAASTKARAKSARSGLSSSRAISSNFSFVDGTLSPLEVNSQIRIRSYTNDADCVAGEHRNGVVFFVDELVRIVVYWDHTFEDHSSQICYRCEG